MRRVYWRKTPKKRARGQLAAGAVLMATMCMAATAACLPHSAEVEAAQRGQARTMPPIILHQPPRLQTVETRIRADIVPNETSEKTGQACAEAEAEQFVPDPEEVEALAKMLWGEARGVKSDTEKAACVWVVLNRVDDPRFGDTVLDVLKAPGQFRGYSRRHPATDELKALAADVLTRYHEEKQGAEDAGRVLPPEYCYFTGDGRRNYFRDAWRGGATWNWSMKSPYEEGGSGND